MKTSEEVARLEKRRTSTMSLTPQGNTQIDPFKSVRPAQGFQSLDPNSGNLADGIGNSYGIIRYKGKVWSLQYKGETHVFTRADDGSPSNYIDVVILRDPGHKARSYYTSYEEGAAGRPICASMDNKYPDHDVEKKQAECCSAAVCPRAVWKTGSDGRRKSECTEYKRLAVLPMPEQTTRMLGAPLIEPVFLRIPPDSLLGLAPSVSRRLRSNGTIRRSLPVSASTLQRHIPDFSSRGTCR